MRLAATGGTTSSGWWNYPSVSLENSVPFPYSALIFAGNYTIPEVCVYFDNKLMRGNRTVKCSAGSLHAFNSPNMTPLANAMIDIKVDYQNIIKPATMKKF